MLFGGADDTIFPGAATSTRWNDAFSKLAIKSVVKMDFVDAGVGHEISDNAWSNLRRFINNENNYVAYTEPEGSMSLTASIVSFIVLGYLALV